MSRIQPNLLRSQPMISAPKLKRGGVVTCLVRPVGETWCLIRTQKGTSMYDASSMPLIKTVIISSITVLRTDWSTQIIQSHPSGLWLRCSDYG
ncbi:hypothetical protein CC1G_12042 [Coprinopsis cinerea okayama7|uniref:Uncharacterized protein n=1 Tax=Coprinopsis cinerea (strain Okayama-7 / 130 / ATCC MYA-4618 / FGSC 9003) TaxID=240176 RepID=A8P8I8_COPC7|nr:hypothetical protein CC1G_12042 [Coprinopsis cinerea okayama7\|eukprot:XP_001839579.2 hypothetical protein CC1G_12042 [Coprinopsis cinerea okayama7\